MDGLGGDDDDNMPDFGPDDTQQHKKQRQDTDEKKVFANTRDGTGKSTSGRNAWKEKHRKGKFSGKKRKSERKFKQPLGI